MSPTRVCLLLLLSSLAANSKPHLALDSMRTISAINNAYEGLMRVLVGLKDATSCLSEQKALLREQILSLSSHLVEAKKDLSNGAALGSIIPDLQKDTLEFTISVQHATPCLPTAHQMNILSMTSSLWTETMSLKIPS